jgi:hypothetical protein
LIPIAYVPRTSGPKQWVPLDKQSPSLRSPWTDGPQTFGPHGQMVPNQFGPPGKMVPKIFCLSRVTGCDDLGTWGPNWLGTICPGGPNFLGTVCSGGPNWLGTICPGGLIFYGPFVQGDRKWGTGSPGIKWVQD